MEVLGSHNGRTIRRIYDLTHPVNWGDAATGRQTGICAGVGAQLLAKHGSREAGFVDPEVFYDPDEFIVELKKRGTLQLSWSDEYVSSTVVERSVDRS